MHRIKLGDKVKDKLSDLEGIVIAKAEYMYGCTQLAIQPQKLINGKPVDDIWIDEPQLELIIDNEKKKEKPAYGGIRNYPK